MENASKALVIAGAILISILLITMGILLINSGRDVANSGKNAMSSSAIQAFNSQFTQYEGTGKSLSEINQLLDIVMSSNASHNNQVIIKLTNLENYNVDIGVMDSARFTVKDEETQANILCSSSNLKTINDIKSTINQYKNLKFKVILHYFKECDYAEKNINPIPRIYICN